MPSVSLHYSMYTAELWECLYVMAAWGCHSARQTRWFLRNRVHVEMTKGLLIITVIFIVDSRISMSFIIIQILSTADILNSCVPQLLCSVHLHACILFYTVFIRPSSDGTYYGMVMSVRVSVRPVSVRPFSALFSYMLWHIEMKFCTWLCFDVLQIKFDCRHFASIFVGVMPLCELRIKVMCSFPHFSPTCFDILSSNFAYDFV